MAPHMLLVDRRACRRGHRSDRPAAGTQCDACACADAGTGMGGGARYAAGCADHRSKAYQPRYFQPAKPGLTNVYCLPLRGPSWRPSQSGRSGGRADINTELRPEVQVPLPKQPLEFIFRTCVRVCSRPDIPSIRPPWRASVPISVTTSIALASIRLIQPVNRSRLPTIALTSVPFTARVTHRR